MRLGTHEVIENLIADNARHFEALLARNRVDDHVAVNADEVLRVEDAILILARESLLADTSQGAVRDMSERSET